ncbi:hypothetical protein [Rhodoplanes roseus]|uniref:Uncharacterized protein n=1 Tax=Rhodoplanes roseus TaxID=29409 RepID=A0A327L7E9_9BRAD|nr:hypothetical protein [Rhodoplanes roseus]RAI45422.1 hypothetical protein CH341_04060 [Rhodoplanes roseus]
MGESGKAQERTARDRRLSAALRENLKRRKAQTRARLDPGEDRQVAAGRPGGAAESHDSAGIVAEKDAG